MRVPIAYEGKATINDQFLEVGCLQWEPDEEFPVVWDFNYAKIVGKAGSLQREDDGSVTALVDMDSLTDGARALFADVGTTLYASDVVARNVNGSMHIISARVRELSLTPNVPWRNPPIDGVGEGVETESEQ